MDQDELNEIRRLMDYLIVAIMVVVELGVFASFTIGYLLIWK